MRALRGAPIAAAVFTACIQVASCRSVQTSNTRAGAPARAPAERSVNEVSASPVPAPGCAFQASWLDATALPKEVGDDACSFHQFMWQSFVFLAQSEGGGTRFESWMPTYGVFVESATQPPTPWGTAPPDPCSPTAAAKGSAKQVDAPLPVYSSITKQAGVDQPLIDRNGNEVYYGIAINKVAYDWVTSCDLYRYRCAAQLGDKKGGIDLIKNYPALAFPIGSVELKTAWKVLTDEEQRLGTFYSVKGKIQPDARRAQTCKSVSLGLVGMHIVSKTAKHPEFIWATFEHRNNAPDCTDLAATAPVTGGWTFFDKASYDRCKEARCTNTYFPARPAMVCREHPAGDSNLGRYPDGKDCSVDPNQLICQPSVKAALTANTAAMNAINESASSVISQSKSYDKVWANYELVGNVWSQGGAVPPITQAQAGSLSAANTSMETFVQNGQAGIQNPSNCFTCHNMVSSAGTTNLPPAGLSHMFTRLNVSSGGCASGRLPEACVVK
jgi:hypothetical protein